MSKYRTRVFGVVAAITLGLVLTAGGCDETDQKTNDAQAQQQADTLEAFNKQKANVPYPKEQLSDPQERHNLAERLLRQNNPNKISYLYVLGGMTGKPIGYYVIKGKISSTQSQMTSSEFELDHGSYGQSVVEAPGDDGSYGPNEPGIFFFTTSGVMVQTDQGYILSDQLIPVGEFDVPKLNK